MMEIVGRLVAGPPAQRHVMGAALGLRWILPEHSGCVDAVSLAVLLSAARGWAPKVFSGKAVQGCAARLSQPRAALVPRRISTAQWMAFANWVPLPAACATRPAASAVRLWAVLTQRWAGWAREAKSPGDRIAAPGCPP